MEPKGEDKKYISNFKGKCTEVCYFTRCSEPLCRYDIRRGTQHFLSFMQLPWELMLSQHFYLDVYLIG